jgi:hypothetical protein
MGSATPEIRLRSWFIKLGFPRGVTTLYGAKLAHAKQQLRRNAVSTNIRVIQPSDFVRATPDGHCDIFAGERLLLDIAEAASDLEDFNVLVDTRKVSGMLTCAELLHLAEKFVNHPHIGRRKTAVLCPEFRLDHSRFFALRAERQGGNVQAFSSYEEAMDWLMGSQPGIDG